MAIKALFAPPVVWAVLTSPARNKHACFLAIANTQPGSIAAALNSDNKYKKICASLCKFVQNNNHKIKVTYGAQAWLIGKIILG
ncbi:hypothetical protein ACJTMZ_08005 [Enterobacter sp. DN]|uniref:hypothetical protein n=1 Tax=Enterobacter sp. DN TaxID=3382156 RepID=UPI0038CC007F